MSKARVDRSTTPDALARSSGIAADVVLAIEAGQHAPTLDELVGLAQALGCDAGDLIERTMAAYGRQASAGHS